jgi:hypothetical protein
VTTEQEAGGERPDSVLAASEPAEDSGAQTQDRYYWQAQCAARMCIAMLTQQQIDQVVCEWHEDHVVVFADGQLEFVSCKHRESSRGTWSLGDLCRIGGLAHLYDRWHPFREHARARVITNAGLRPGRTESAQLARVCARAASGLTVSDPELQACVRALAIALLRARQARELPAIPLVDLPVDADWSALPEGFERDVAQFVARLQIDTDIPGRQHLAAHDIQQLVRPALGELRCDPAEAERLYRDVVDLVCKRSRDRPRNPESLARYLADPHRGARERQLKATVAARTIYRDEVRALLPSTLDAQVGKGEIPLLPTGVRSPTVPRRSSQLVTKMQRGGLGDAAIETARRLRGAWLRTWAAARSDLPGDIDELFDLETRVLDVVAAVESQARLHGPGYELRLHLLLQQHLTVEALGRRPPVPLDRLHLQGLAFDLCGRCKFDFGHSDTRQHAQRQPDGDHAHVRPVPETGAHDDG